MAQASFPNSIVTWKDKIDFVDTLKAQDVNKAYAEIIAVETAIQEVIANEPQRQLAEQSRETNEANRELAEDNRALEFDAIRTAYEQAITEGTDLEVTGARHDSVTNTDYANLGARLDADSQKVLDVEEKIPFISAEVFGIVGDGIADDTQKLIDADAYSVANKIKIVYPRKTFLVTSSLDFQGQHDFSYGTVKTNNDIDVFIMHPSTVLNDVKIDITGATTYTKRVIAFDTATYQAWLDDSNRRFNNLNGIFILSGDNTGTGIDFRAVKEVGSTGGWYISGINISDICIFGAIGKGLSFYAEDLVGEGGDYTSAWCDHNCVSNIQFYNNKKPIHIYGKANNNQIINYIIQNDTTQTPADLPDIAIGKCWDRGQIKLKNMDYAYGGNYILGGMSPAYFSEPDGVKLSPVMSSMFNRMGLYTNLCGFKTMDLSYSQGDLLKGTYSILDEFDGANLHPKWRLTALNSNTSAVSMGATVRTNGRHLKGVKLIPASTVVGDYVQMDMNSNCMLSKDLTFDALITFSPIDWANYGKWRVGFYRDENNYILLEKDERNYADNTVLFKCKNAGTETVKTLTFGWNYSYTLFKAVFSVSSSKVDLKLSKEWQGAPTQGSSTNMFVSTTNTQNLVFENITTNIPSGLLQPYFRIECNEVGQNTRLYVHSLEIVSRRLKTQ